MTFTQFRYLSEDEQEKLLWSRGVELMRQADEQYIFILFQVDGFYMELKFNISLKYVSQIIYFEDLGYLEKYLQEINISSLIGYV